MPRNHNRYSPRQGYNSPRLNTQNRRSEPTRFAFNSPLNIQNRRVGPTRFAFNNPLNMTNNLTPVVVAPSQEHFLSELIKSSNESKKYTRNPLLVNILISWSLKE